MKKYVKNKNFIPEDFIINLNLISDKKESRLIVLLLIINICIFPSTVVKIANNFSSSNSVEVSMTIDTKEENKTNNLKILINSISDNIKVMNIKNDSGNIEVDSIEDINNIDKEGKLKIDSIDIDNEVINMEVSI